MVPYCSSRIAEACARLLTSGHRLVPWNQLSAIRQLDSHQAARLVLITSVRRMVMFEPSMPQCGAGVVPGRARVPRAGGLQHPAVHERVLHPVGRGAGGLGDRPVEVGVPEHEPSSGRDEPDVAVHHSGVDHRVRCRDRAGAGVGGHGRGRCVRSGVGSAGEAATLPIRTARHVGRRGGTTAGRVDPAGSGDLQGPNLRAGLPSNALPRKVARTLYMPRGSFGSRTTALPLTSLAPARSYLPPPP